MHERVKDSFNLQENENKARYFPGGAVTWMWKWHRLYIHGLFSLVRDV